MLRMYSNSGCANGSMLVGDASVFCRRDLPVREYRRYTARRLGCISDCDSGCVFGPRVSFNGCVSVGRIVLDAAGGNSPCAIGMGEVDRGIVIVMAWSRVTVGCKNCESSGYSIMLSSMLGGETEDVRAAMICDRVAGAEKRLKLLTKSMAES